jgi:hypothetical protein
MRYFYFLLLLIPLLTNANEKDFKEGDEFQAKKFEAIAVYLYKADASRVNTARELYFSLNDFLDHATVDTRDIFRIRKGDTFTLTKSFRNGDIFEVNLKSQRAKREKYFVLSEDLKNSSLELIVKES